jgi:hypothetical protein
VIGPKVNENEMILAKTNKNTLNLFRTMVIRDEKSL